jgi:chemotaxis protein CheX
MDIKRAFIDSVAEVLPMFGLNCTFLGETEESILASVNQVNVLIGFTDGVKGNMMVALKKATAVKIASAMMGAMELDELDDIAVSAIGEMANLFAGYMSGKLQGGPVINFSPPTLAIGERMFLMISRIKTTKLTFGLEGETLDLSFCLER